MTLKELQAAIGGQVVVLTGSPEGGYEKRIGHLDNIINYEIIYPDRTERNLEATVTITDDHPVTLQVKAKNVFAADVGKDFDDRIIRLNAAVDVIKTDTADTGVGE